MNGKFKPGPTHPYANGLNSHCMIRIDETQALSTGGFGETKAVSDIYSFLVATRPIVKKNIYSQPTMFMQVIIVL